HLRGTHFPSAMAFGAAGSDDLVAAAAEVTARELRAVGIHFNFAPDLDVNSNPANPVIGVRSYGEDPALVARLGTRAITAMQAGGVLATARSEEHTSELQSLAYLVCRLLLEKKKHKSTCDAEAENTLLYNSIYF